MEFICPARYLDAASEILAENSCGPSFGLRVQSLTSPVRSRLMLDIAYVVIGAVFLGACVLYALACDIL
jgi:hypothetical protein